MPRKPHNPNRGRIREALADAIALIALVAVCLVFYIATP